VQLTKYVSNYQLGVPLQALLDGHHPSVDFEGKPLPSWLDRLKGKPITGQFP
jgi:hypothetical protein